MQQPGDTATYCGSRLAGSEFPQLPIKKYLVSTKQDALPAGQVVVKAVQSPGVLRVRILPTGGYCLPPTALAEAFTVCQLLGTSWSAMQPGK